MGEPCIQITCALLVRIESQKIRHYSVYRQSTSILHRFVQVGNNWVIIFEFASCNTYVVCATSKASDHPAHMGMLKIMKPGKRDIGGEK